MRILYIAGNPDTAVNLQLDTEITLFREKLDQADTSESIDIRAYPRLELDALADTIVRNSPDIIHFSAHGSTRGISLAVSKDRQIVLDGANLSRIILALPVRPKLIVVSACSSATMAEELKDAADFVIGMDAPITNAGARTFAANLYQRLANGSSIGEAFTSSASLLDVLERQSVKAQLFPPDHKKASRSFVANPFRILVNFPDVERWLEKGHTTPHKGFDVDEPAVQFGLCGVPATTRQAMLFTDDSSIQPNKKQSLFDARGWFVEAHPARGEIWFDEVFTYWGDMEWYASVTTGDCQIYSCKSSLAAALDRYYFVEALRGELPDAIAGVVAAAIENLKANDGARRRLPPVARGN